MYSASTLDNDTQFYFHDRRLLPRVKMFPVIDFLSSRSVAQSESQYIVKIGYFYMSIISLRHLVVRKYLITFSKVSQQTSEGDSIFIPRILTQRQCLAA